MPDHRQRQPLTPAPNTASRGLYAPGFLRQERAIMATLVHADSLDAEIALLRILIRRQLLKPPSDLLQDGGATMSVDVRKVCRCIETLCRAITVRRSAGDNTNREIDDVLRGVLAEIHGELQTTGSPLLATALSPPMSE